MGLGPTGLAPLRCRVDLASLLVRDVHVQEDPEFLARVPAC